MAKQFHDSYIKTCPSEALITVCFMSASWCLGSWSMFVMLGESTLAGSAKARWRFRLDAFAKVVNFRLALTLRRCASVPPPSAPRRWTRLASRWPASASAACCRPSTPPSSSTPKGCFPRRPFPTTPTRPCPPRRSRLSRATPVSWTR